MASVLEENGYITESCPRTADSDVESGDTARHKLESLLNRNMRIQMTDGRSLIGCFLCTDRDCNVILGSAQEFLRPSAPSPCQVSQHRQQWRNYRGSRPCGCRGAQEA
ncbi:N-alpha-acetyltransferase 38-B, NatC auxiliary subunit isoform X1 [Xenopus laevis]|uniref:N-alpha-acetyltransferase 38-B, NatC auxiliary subunit isoform X1 n=1 Tax=Xenopus laevis TaxID=8355 RepID=A0A8J0U1P5_XENLA|nr:N-alpha-acetyltransferase 38-B, NatC auxiliary subunit isoform X1 [Xenopus laevis]